ncbi:hypothetical protein EJ05DRAFT_280134 [Pseudovirgaria hyperparasitica]|uniref:Uncharacterized protein n=1 Tax=Pseudovirgaria hyperparasitica TaxID=470096 RepID=A0A6A6WBW3_9PEZI|nr:uncharacterized protein EJ05DRAFT_280134 [Pseudovirgaria hyperparasitica]KAF2760338.1 hypothetical protein EJ05DRAFT_280134 [Pseudovirgaria hyperparasitica]
MLFIALLSAAFSSKATRLVPQLIALSLLGPVIWMSSRMSTRRLWMARLLIVGTSAQRRLEIISLGEQTQVLPVGNNVLLLSYRTAREAGPECGTFEKSTRMHDITECARGQPIKQGRCVPQSRLELCMMHSLIAVRAARRQFAACR